MAGSSTDYPLRGFNNPLDSLSVLGGGVTIPDRDTSSQYTLNDAAVEVHKHCVLMFHLSEKARYVCPLQWRWQAVED